MAARFLDASSMTDDGAATAAVAAGAFVEDSFCFFGGGEGDDGVGLLLDEKLLGGGEVDCEEGVRLLDSGTEGDRESGVRLREGGAEADLEGLLDDVDAEMDLDGGFCGEGDGSSGGGARLITSFIFPFFSKAVREVSL